MSSSSRVGANSEALWLAFPVQVTLSRRFFFCTSGGSLYLETGHCSTDWLSRSVGSNKPDLESQVRQLIFAVGMAAACVVVISFVFV